MKVFFTCSAKNINKNLENYNIIRSTIISLGHTITRDWLKKVIKLYKQGRSDTPSYKFYKDVMGAIHTADVVIADTTIPTMALGHQITYALENNKPTLLVSSKSKLKKNIFIEGSHSDNLIIEKYSNKQQITTIVKNFLATYDNKNVTRFNLALTQQESDYINWASYYYKKTKTEVIQQSLDATLKEDNNYHKFLKRKL